MKLRNHQFSIRPPIFENGNYEHPWYEHVEDRLIRPNPPSPDLVRRAKFKDKTYRWNGGVRSGNKRTS